LSSFVGNLKKTWKICFLEHTCFSGCLLNFIHKVAVKVHFSSPWILGIVLRLMVSENWPSFFSLDSCKKKKILILLLCWHDHRWIIKNGIRPLIFSGSAQIFAALNV
jgi:hypothetical protein